jgi:hypothetical protein
MSENEMTEAEARAVVQRAEETKAKQRLAQTQRQAKVRQARALLEKVDGGQK